MQRKLVLNIALYIVWIGLLFATLSSGAASLGIYRIFIPFQMFYNTGTSNSFPGIEFSCITLFALVTILLNQNRNFYISNNYISYISISIIIFISLVFINPNNSTSNSIFDFLSIRISRTMIFLPIGFFVLISLNRKNYSFFIYNFFKIGLFVGLTKACLDLLTFITKSGVINYYGRYITTFGGDVQIWFSILSIATFTIFLHLKKKKYLIFSVIFLLCLLFSYQRTALLISAFYNLSFYVIYQYQYKIKLNRLFVFLIVIFLSIIYLFPIVLNTNYGKDLYLRYFSVFKIIGITIENKPSLPEYSDSGHIQQSTSATEFLLKNYNNFWGGGINRRNERYLYIEGQSGGGVHNNIVSMWQYFGIPGVAFLVLIFLLNLYYFFKTILNRQKLNFNSYVTFAVSYYFIIRIIAGWFSGDFFFMYYQICLQYIILLSLFKISNVKEDYLKKLLLPE